MSRRKRLRNFPENIVSNFNIDLCLNFHRVYAQLRLQLDEELGIFHGIDFDDFALLHALAGADGPTSLARLSAELGVARSVMLRRLRPLEKIGLVDFHGGVTDRRIALRPAGRGLITTANETVGGVCAQQPLIEGLDRLGKSLLTPELVRGSQTGMDARQ
jgi:MarR family transcriptional regulator, organic hydroperoxide resistance regulator